MSERPIFTLTIKNTEAENLAVHYCNQHGLDLHSFVDGNENEVVFRYQIPDYSDVLSRLSKNLAFLYQSHVMLQLRMNAEKFEQKKGGFVTRETAAAIVEEIISDLNGRKHMGLHDVDDETQAEIRNEWVDIVMSHCLTEEV